MIRWWTQSRAWIAFSFPFLDGYLCLQRSCHCTLANIRFTVGDKPRAIDFQCQQPRKLWSSFESMCGFRDNVIVIKPLLLNGTANLKVKHRRTWVELGWSQSKLFNLIQLCNSNRKKWNEKLFQLIEFPRKNKFNFSQNDNKSEKKKKVFKPTKRYFVLQGSKEEKITVKSR